MPDWLEWFAERQPMTLVMNEVRDWTLGIDVYQSELAAIAWCVGILVVCFPLGMWLYEKRTTQ